MVPAPTRPVAPAAPRLLLLLALVAGVLVAGGGTAHAATGYRYWNYFHVEDGSYQFATTGPSGYKPRNGSVEAYRYGLSTTSEGVQPRTAATTYSFADICRGTHAAGGKKRVGVLLDYGTPADAASGETPPAPRAACAVVPADANGQQVLDQVSDLRVEKQLVCGIDGYPASGCSVTVKDPPKPAPEHRVDFTLPRAASASSQGASKGASKGASPSSDASPTSGKSADDSASQDQGGVSWPLVGVLAAVVVIGGGGLLLSRRRREP